MNAQYEKLKNEKLRMSLMVMNYLVALAVLSWAYDRFHQWPLIKGLAFVACGVLVVLIIIVVVRSAIQSLCLKSEDEDR